MLMVGAPKQRVHWDQAGIWLDLVPLTEDRDQAFIRDTLIEVRDDKGALTNVKRDTVRYAQLVGRHCIKDWGGVLNADKQPLECTPEAIDQFMLIDPAQTFVFSRVKGLALHLADEVTAAKNA